MKPTRTTAFYRRLGHLESARREPNMRWSRAIQVCATWRSHFAWHLTNALGWRRPGAPEGRR